MKCHFITSTAACSNTSEKRYYFIFLAEAVCHSSLVLFSGYSDVFLLSFVSYEVFNNLSLLITVEGKNPSLTPYLLAAHFDVFPFIQGEWKYPGFGAMQTDNDSIVYGRGAMDDKGNVVAMLGALKFMLSREIQLQRGFFIGFGHDEEVSGKDGAKKIAQALIKRGVKKLDFVLDEGTPVMAKMFPGINQPVAGISVSEKGMVSFNLTVIEKVDMLLFHLNKAVLEYWPPL